MAGSYILTLGDRLLGRLSCCATVPEDSNFSSNVTTVEWQGHFPKEKKEPSLFHFKSIHKSEKDVVTTKGAISEDDIKLNKYNPPWRERSGQLYSLNLVYKTNQTYDYALSITRNCSSAPVSCSQPQLHGRYTGFVIDVTHTSFIVGSGPFVLKVPIKEFAKYGIRTSNVNIPFQSVIVKNISPGLSQPCLASLVSVEKIIPKKSLPVVGNPVRCEKQDQTSSSVCTEIEDEVLPYSDSDTFREVPITMKDFVVNFQSLKVRDFQPVKVNGELASTLSPKKHTHIHVSKVFFPYMGGSQKEKGIEATPTPKKHSPSLNCLTSLDALSPKASSWEYQCETIGIGVVTV
ncbi:uncharacterized protein LOC143027669 [Oratosquilla oratoria]|uniref:uncharacterized protein LOC143027669 n=1 Tax=Oratosquilla oratoria TaxID=337810 RepID=UPI003F759891